MKIVEDKIWWEFTCKACGCHCQAEPDDVTLRQNSDYEGDVVGYICVVECGKCGKEKDVPNGKITERIEMIAKRKRKSSQF